MRGREGERGRKDRRQRAREVGRKDPGACASRDGFPKVPHVLRASPCSAASVVVPKDCQGRLALAESWPAVSFFHILGPIGRERLSLAVELEAQNTRTKEGGGW